MQGLSPKVFLFPLYIGTRLLLHQLHGKADKNCEGQKNEDHLQSENFCNFCRFHPSTMPPRAQFSAPQRTWLTLEYHKRRSTNKKESFLDQLLLDFQTAFPGVRRPSAKAVRKMHEGFERSGTVLNRNSINSPGNNHSGRRRTVRTDQNKQNLKAVLDRDATKKIGDATKSPCSSARRNALQLDKSSFSRLVKDLKYHPYKE